MEFRDEEIAAAARLMGVELTAAERAQMADNLGGQIEMAAARRRLAFPNALPPATRFDPRPPGFAMPDPGPFRPSGRDPGPLPGRDEDIAFAPAQALAAWIRSGALAARRLVEIYLARIAELGPRLSCFATVTADLARAEADALDARAARGDWAGPLHGLPYALKDLFDTKGVVTGWGAEPFRDRVPETDARIVTLLREAGAVLLGKSAVGALAYGDIWYGGRTRNPWNPNEGASGSSAGSGSAVAAGLCAFAIGTETLGSITSPCQRTGATGLRPTFGRVSRAGAMALCPSLDKVGPMARTVEDCALVLSVLNGADPADPATIEAPFGWDARRPPAGLTLGWLPAAFGEGATEVDRAALAVARGLGLPLREVALPDLPWGSLMAILYAEAAASFEELTLSGADDTLTWQEKGSWPNTFRKARFLSAVDHVQADRLRTLALRALDAMFREVDVLVGPFSTGPMLVLSNFTGHPCLHLRAGFERLPSRTELSLAEGRLDLGQAAGGGRLYEVPSGISLWGPLFREDLVLSVGRALEERFRVWDRRPGLPD